MERIPENREEIVNLYDGNILVIDKVRLCDSYACLAKEIRINGLEWFENLIARKHILDLEQPLALVDN